MVLPDLLLTGTGTYRNWYLPELVLTETGTYPNWYLRELVLTGTGTYGNWFLPELVLTGTDTTRTGTYRNWYSAARVWHAATHSGNWIRAGIFIILVPVADVLQATAGKLVKNNKDLYHHANILKRSAMSQSDKGFMNPIVEPFLGETYRLVLSYECVSPYVCVCVCV